jgi:hypothetical protein
MHNITKKMVSDSIVFLIVNNLPNNSVYIGSYDAKYKCVVDKLINDFNDYFKNNASSTFITNTSDTEYQSQLHIDKFFDVPDSEINGDLYNFTPLYQIFDMFDDDFSDINSFRLSMFTNNSYKDLSNASDDEIDSYFYYFYDNKSIPSELSQNMQDDNSEPIDLSGDVEYIDTHLYMTMTSTKNINKYYFRDYDKKYEAIIKKLAEKYIKYSMLHPVKYVIKYYNTHSGCSYDDNVDGIDYKRIDKFFDISDDELSADLYNFGPLFDIFKTYNEDVHIIDLNTFRLSMFKNNLESTDPLENDLFQDENVEYEFFESDEDMDSYFFDKPELNTYQVTNYTCTII